jgi:hypothetical protein
MSNNHVIDANSTHEPFEHMLVCSIKFVAFRVHKLPPLLNGQLGAITIKVVMAKASMLMEEVMCTLSICSSFLLGTIN